MTARPARSPAPPVDVRLLAPSATAAQLHAALAAGAARATGARAVVLHLDDPVAGTSAPVAAHGAHPAPVDHVIALTGADGAPLGRLTAAGGDRALLDVWGARTAAALQAHADACEREREAGALARLSTLAPAIARDPDAAVVATCAAVRDELGFGVAEAAVVHDGVLRGAGAASAPALLPGLTEDELLGLLAAAAPADGCHLLPRAGAPAGWPTPRPRAAGPAAWLGHSVLVVLRDRAGAVVGVLRAAAPADGRHPSRGRLRLLAAFAAQAGAALAVRDAARRDAAASGALLDAALDAVLTVDADGRLVGLNATAEQTLGLDRGTALGADVADLLVSEDERAAFRAAVAEGGHRLLRGRHEVVVRRPDGRELPAELSVARTRVGGAPGFTAFLRDLSALGAARDERDRARHATRHDTLTGLPNRRGVEARLRALAARPDPPASIGALHVVVGDFRAVNDSLGHAAGDQVLRLLARRLVEELAGCTVARLDGASFLVLLEGLRGDGLSAASATARWVHDTLVRPLLVEGLEVALRASIGVAVLAPREAAGGELLKRADVAVGRAKAAGGGTAIFSPTAADARRRLSLAVDLRRAIARDELELHFQPLVRLAPDGDQGIGSLEALVRWRRADGELVPPGEFIPFAEASGLIEPLGDWVLEEACRQARAWRDQGLPEVTVGVNVSPRQLRRGGLPRRVASMLARHGLDTRTLVVEITESALRDGGARLDQAVRQLAELGVRWALDDFGAEWSSLSRLRELPVEVLKVDRAFVRHVPRDPRARGLLGAILALAEALGARTVVEGIETPEQLAFVRSAGAALGQGFLLGRPAPPEATAALLHAEGERRARDRAPQG